MSDIALGERSSSSPEEVRLMIIHQRRLMGKLIAGLTMQGALKIQENLKKIIICSTGTSANDYVLQ